MISQWNFQFVMTINFVQFCIRIALNRMIHMLVLNAHGASEARTARGIPILISPHHSSKPLILITSIPKRSAEIKMTSLSVFIGQFGQFIRCGSDCLVAIKRLLTIHRLDIPA